MGALEPCNFVWKELYARCLIVVAWLRVKGGTGLLFVRVCCCVCCCLFQCFFFLILSFRIYSGIYQLFTIHTYCCTSNLKYNSALQLYTSPSTIIIPGLLRWVIAVEKRRDTQIDGVSRISIRKYCCIHHR